MASNNSTDSELDAFADLPPSRYVVGIDLGTTNSAVCFVDTEKSPEGIESFTVEQFVDTGVVERRELLPSFHYQPTSSECEVLPGVDKDAPEVVGVFARDRGLVRPGRQVQSAKSWLCHGGVDRRAEILPWQSDEDDVVRISPVEASAAYLAQIHRAWNKAHPAHPLSEQEVVLTLPASFDQVARQLTIEAAAKAGLKRILPIEEPQAAFYAWLAKHRDEWQEKVSAGQSILVCDIGGGTTDFTLIRVHQATGSGKGDISESVGGMLSLHRVAVGQHLILGGDNIDLALAKMAEQKLTGGETLPPRQWESLRSAARVAKETLLGDSAPESFTIHIASAGSKLIGGGKQVEVSAEDVDRCLLDGFFPISAFEDRPASQEVGFQEFGLPFATDAAITKHLSAFLWDNRLAGRTDAEMEGTEERELARPDWVLFNGGVMTSSKIRSRVLGAIGNWFDESGKWQPGELEGDRLERAVASGAAYFGVVRRGKGVQIEAKLACSFYMQTEEDPPRGVCIVPGNASLGDSFSLDDQQMSLSIGTPVQFPIYFSSARLADRVGDTVELAEEEFQAMPPVRTVVQYAGRRRAETAQVVLETQLTQIGTLEMYCRAADTQHRWKLEFDVRGSTQTDHQASDDVLAADGLLDEGAVEAARAVLSRVFTPEGDLKPNRLVKQLAADLEMGKAKWPPSLLRAIWAELMDLQEARKISPSHEARWLNLAGYCLRPGYGMAADDWRVAQVWRTIHGKLCHAAVASRDEALILWRRIAGGFTAGQQLTVYQQVASPLRGVLDPARRAKGGGGVTPNELIELLRLVGSLELLPASEKRTLGGWLVSMLGNRKWSACQSSVLWALGRLGSRTPAYGPLNCVLSPSLVENWIAEILRRDIAEGHFALMLTARKVGDRYRDISDEVRGEVLEHFDRHDAPAKYRELVAEGGELEGEFAAEMLGEALPLGLRLG